MGLSDSLSLTDLMLTVSFLLARLLCSCAPVSPSIYYTVYALSHAEGNTPRARAGESERPSRQALYGFVTVHRWQQIILIVRQVSPAAADSYRLTIQDSNDDQVHRPQLRTHASAHLVVLILPTAPVGGTAAAPPIRGPPGWTCVRAFGARTLRALSG